MNLYKVYTYAGHAFAAIGTGWGLIYHITGQGLLPAIAGGTLAVYAWSRAHAFKESD